MELFKLIGRLAVEGADEAERDINDVAGAAEKSSNKIVESFKKVGSIVATVFAVDKIVDFGKAAVQAGAEVAAEEAAFSQIMGDYASAAAEKIGKIADATGMIDSRLTPYMTSMTAKFKGLGYEVDDATDLASRGLNLAADAAAFWDKSLEDSMGGLNSFINGSYEGGEAIGLFANETQLAAFAIEQGLISESKEWANLEEKIKQATRLEYAEAMFALSGAVGQASKESGAYANVLANLQENWRQFKAVIGEPLIENVVIPAMQKLGDVIGIATEKVQDLMKWFSQSEIISKLGDAFGDIGQKVQDVLEYLTGLKDEFSQMSPVINGVVVSLGAFATSMAISSAIAALKKGIDALKISFLALNAAMKKNAFVLIISLVAGLVAGFVTLWKTNEEFRNFWIGLWETIKSACEPVIEFLRPAIEKIKEVFSQFAAEVPSHTDKIKSAFQSFGDKVKSIIDKVKSIFEEFKGWISPIIETIVGFFQSLAEKVSNVIASIKQSLAPLGEEISGAFQYAWESIRLVWDMVQPYFAGIWEGIQAVFSVVGTVLSGFFSTAWQLIQLVWNMVVPYFQLLWTHIQAVFSVVGAVLSGFFITAWTMIQAVWNTAVSFFTLVWAGIKAVFAVVKGVLSGNFKDAWEAIKNVWSRAKDFFSTVWDSIKSVFGSVASWFKSVFSAAWEAIKSVFSGWGAFFGKLWDQIKEKFVTIGTNIANAISSSVKTGLNSVISMIEGTINSGINLINAAIRLANKIPGVNVGEIGSITLPRLAKGGIVTRSTIAEIGEDGAEAVVPLEKNTEWMDKLASKLNGGNPATMNRIIELLEELTSMKIYLNNEVLVGELTPAIDTRLGDINRLRARGK